MQYYQIMRYKSKFWQKVEILTKLSYNIKKWNNDTLSHKNEIKPT